MQDKFIGSKRVKKYFPRETFIDKVIQLKRSFVLWQKPLETAGSIYRMLKKSKIYFPLESFIDKAIQFNKCFMMWQIPLKVLC